MVAKNQHDWETLKEKLKAGLKNGQVSPNWEAAARFLGVNVGTLRNAAKREWSVTSCRELIDEALTDELPSKLGLDVEEDGNRLEVNYVGEQVITIGDLIRTCKIDLSQWALTDQRPNAWQSGMKVKRLENDHIVEHVVIVQLHQIQAWFVKIHPVPIAPVITPMDVPAFRFSRPKQKKAGLRRALILADPQVGFRRRLHTTELVPFHDRRVMDIALQLLQAEPFDNVSLIGDVLDMSEWSTKYLIEPEFYWTTQPALIELAWWLTQFREAAPSAEMDLYEGNHDMRPETAIVTHLKAAYKLRAVDELQLPHALSVPRLLALHRLAINYRDGYPDNARWLNRNVLIRHGDTVRAGPGDSAKAIALKTTYTTIFGHIHRRELVSRRIKSREGDVIQTAFSPGCACHIDGRVPGSKSDDQWQQGLAVVEYADDIETIIPVPIDAGRAVYKGQLLTAGDRDAKINKMINRQLEKMG